MPSTQTSQGNKVRVAETLGEVRAQLAISGLPVPENKNLSILLKKDGKRIAVALKTAINKEEGWEQQFEYVKGAVITVSSWMHDSLKKLNIVPPPPSMLLDIYNQEGKTFWLAVKSALEGGQEAKIAEEYVLRTISAISVNDAPAAMPVDEKTQPNEADGQNQHGSTETAREPTKERSANQTTEGNREFRSVHVYGGKSALCFNEDVTRDNEATVRVEGALSSGERAYDWKNKVSLQFTLQEMPLVLGLFHGFINKLELKNHGRQNDKAIIIENQGDKFYVNMLSKGESPRAVPVPAKDVYPIITLFLRQMLKNDAFLDTGYLIKLSQRICSMHAGTDKQS